MNVSLHIFSHWFPDKCLYTMWKVKVGLLDGSEIWTCGRRPENLRSCSANGTDSSQKHLWQMVTAKGKTMKSSHNETKWYLNLLLLDYNFWVKGEQEKPNCLNKSFFIIKKCLTFPEFLISWCLKCFSRKHLKMCSHFCIPLLIIYVKHFFVPK